MRRSSASRAPSPARSGSLRPATLKLVRDPVGTYPFFFAESSGRIAFGVDAEPLLSLPWVSRALNRAAIADHLSHRWLSWHETHYQDLSRVPAGFVVTWQGGARRFERYWYPVDPSGNVEWVREDALDQFQEVFEQAIERCLGQGPRGYLPQRRDSTRSASASLPPS